MYRLYVVAIFTFFLGLVQAQNMRQWQPLTGLPTKEVYEVYCDSKGFIWIGHAQGISRFDGNRLLHFSHPQQNSLGISNIREDKQGRIWCRNFGGQIFYVERNKMYLLDAYDWKQQQTFPTIFINEYDQLIASHNKGLFVYDINTRQHKVVAPESSNEVLNNFSLGICNNTGMGIWDNHLYRLTKPYHLQQIKTSFSQNHSLASFATIIGNAKDTIYLLNKNRDTALACYVSNNQCTEARAFAVPIGIYGIYQLADASIWVCSKSKSYALKDKEVTIPDGTTSVCLDKENHFWYSSLQYGIVYASSQTNSIRALALKPSVGEAFRSIAQHDNGLAVSTNLGKLLLLDANGKIKDILKEPTATHIDAILSTKDNQLYAGSAYLLAYNTKAKRLDSIASLSSIKDLAIDANANIYVANSFSLTKVLPKHQKQVLRPKRCRAVKACGNAIYAAFADGLFEFDGYGKEQELLFNNQSIYTVSLASANDTLAIASLGNGVMLFVNGILKKHFTAASGLLGVQSKKIKIANGKIWVLTDVGLDCILPNGSVTHYTSSNQIDFVEVLDFCISNTNIFLVTNSNLYALPMQANQSIKPPTVFIDAIFINNSDSMAFQKNQFSYNQNNIEFILSGLSINSASNLGFRYRLKGADSTWQTVNANQYKIAFPALLPGEYTFEAKAIAIDGTGSNTVQYAFVINKPWWQQWWFFTLVILMAMAIVYVFFKQRMHTDAQRNKLLLDKLNLQSDLRDSMLTAIKSQMNPHFIFNALNTIQSYIYTSDENKASNYLGKFSDLIRQILDNSQRKQISLAKEIDMLQLYIDLELMRFENTLQATIEVDPSLNLDSIQLPPMLIQPYVENAIKHGLLHKPNNRVLKIIFKANANNQVLLVTIDDNGVGRAASAAINEQRRKSYKSFASFANQHRFELLQQSLDKQVSLEIIDKQNEQGQPIGTTVVIAIPF